MGYKKVPRIHTLVFDGELEGLVVRMKGLKLGEMRKLTQIMDEDDKDTLNELPAFLVRNIHTWNLEDQDGVEMPVSVESFDELDLDDLLAIANKWMDEILGKEPELGKDSPSGEQFPGRPVTMEAL